MHIQAHFPLRDYNTFHIEAKARYFVEIDKQSDIRALRSDPILATLPWYVLGEGSNILLTRDLDGVVVRNRFRQCRVMKEDDETVWVSVGGGMHWHDLVTWSVDNNLWGLENLALIPGTVGAAPVQNIGAYGTEVQDVITRVQALDLFTGERHEFRNADCQFSYRSSIFKREYRNQLLIHRATFRLRKLHAGHPNLVYDPLREALEGVPEHTLTPRHIYDAIIRLRTAKLPDPAKEGNAGSFFKNPVVDDDYFAVLEE
uniref:UDP-N-acetylmuramate dehydrogenase n=1 Tax=Alcanivorax sp. TaxID=1872427 RepID=UPI00258AFE95